MLSEIGRHGITTWTWPEFSKQFHPGSYCTFINSMTCKLSASIFDLVIYVSNVEWLELWLSLTKSFITLSPVIFLIIVQFCLLMYNIIRESDSCNSCRLECHYYILIMTRTNYLNSKNFNWQEFCNLDVFFKKNKTNLLCLGSYSTSKSSRTIKKSFNHHIANTASNYKLWCCFASINNQ